MCACGELLSPHNYNSQQDAERRREREGWSAWALRLSSMATVLSRALKLPGKGSAPAGGRAPWAALSRAGSGQAVAATFWYAPGGGEALFWLPGGGGERCHGDVAMWGEAQARARGRPGRRGGAGVGE